MQITCTRLSDALTHVGQIVMLRRMAGAPIRSEGYFKADIVAGAIDEAVDEA
jgi:hypothetical protein